ncbi:SRPBCC family protein [Geobacter sp.]|uniref:SRPBCC family protein n=1 Tax=Geobacter sp. TaxID=46610 RepID=UPI0027B88F89|nr:SRPBCC family protein [Geobacter sp.]
MKTLICTIEVRAPASATWELLTDTRRWHLWGPSVTAVECSERFIGPGSVGWVRTVIGLRVPFRITEYIAGRRWCWEVAGIPATGHRVEPLGPDRCRVVFEVPFLAAPYLAVCRLAGERIRRILEEENRGP